MAQTRPLFVFFVLFSMKNKYSTNFDYKFDYELSTDVVHGNRTWPAGWKAKTIPMSYGGTPILIT